MAIEMHHGQPDNLLLAYLMDTYKKIKPHTSMLLAGVLVLIALLYGYRWLINKGEAQKVETYAAIFEALSSGKTESLEDIADELEGTPEEPTTPEYEQEKGAEAELGGEEEMGLGGEEEMDFGGL